MTKAEKSILYRHSLGAELRAIGGWRAIVGHSALDFYSCVVLSIAYLIVLHLGIVSTIWWNSVTLLGSQFAASVATSIACLVGAGQMRARLFDGGKFAKKLDNHGLFSKALFYFDWTTVTCAMLLLSTAVFFVSGLACASRGAFLWVPAFVATLLVFSWPYAVWSLFHAQSAARMYGALFLKYGG